MNTTLYSYIVTLQCNNSRIIWNSSSSRRQLQCLSLKKQYPQTVNRSTSSVSKLSSLHTYSQHLQCPRPKTYNIKFGALFAPKALENFPRFSIRLP